VYFSAIELNEMIMMLGYTWDRIMYYQYLIHDLDLDNGLRDLGSDQDVLELVKVEVDMENSHSNIDVNANFIGSGNFKKHITFAELNDVYVLDNDEFESGYDDDVEKVRKSKLKELRKQLGKNADGGKNQPYFYVGQSFRTAKAAKERIKLYSIETMR
ncbi:hypothetical protein Tco_1090502, partial [Tanacetum coccineum]